MALIRRNWTPADADDWTKEDWYAIVISPLYGGTNRQGQHYQYQYRANKKSSIVVDFYTMTTIKTKVYQSDLNIVFLEYNYDI